MIDLRAQAVGLTGVAYVLPAAVAPGAGSSRVYLKRMLLGTKVPTLLPDWVFFVRAVVDADGLTPVASREQLRDDDVLAAVREELGRQVIRWVLSTVEGGGSTAHRFVSTHHLALRALALTDDDVLDLVARTVPFETTAGPATLADLAADGAIAYTRTTQAFRAVESVARAQGLAVVNAGYVYDADLLARLDTRPGFTTHEFDPASLGGMMALPTAEREVATAGALAAARGLLSAVDCDVVLRQFRPAATPAVLLRDAEGERRRELDGERAAAPDLWGGLLDALAEDGGRRPTRTLALNDTSPVVRALLGRRPSDAMFDAGVRTVYSTAVLLSGEPLRPREAATLNDALTTLLTSGGAQRTEDDVDTEEKDR